MKRNQNATAPGIPAISDSIRKATVADLNTQLSHLLDLAASAKQAHWNVMGPNFTALHELFDSVATHARDHADLVAERARALGGLAHGTIRETAANSTLEPFPGKSTDWKMLTSTLREHALACAARLRGSAAAMGNEPATQDLYIGIIEVLEKDAWMLGSHLG